jgi:hypothetical protein
MSDEALCFHRALFWAVAIAFRSAAFSCELNPHCAVKDFWSKEREKKDNRSSGLG